MSEGSLSPFEQVPLQTAEKLLAMEQKMTFLQDQMERMSNQMDILMSFMTFPQLPPLLQSLRLLRHIPKRPSTKSSTKKEEYEGRKSILEDSNGTARKQIRRNSETNSCVSHKRSAPIRPSTMGSLF